jgi:hypothetical protein
MISASYLIKGKRLIAARETSPDAELGLKRFGEIE